MKKLIMIVSLIMVVSIVACKQNTNAFSFAKDATMQVVETTQDEKYPEIYYQKYNDNLVVEIDTEFGSRNVIKDGEYIIGIAGNNTKSNEEIFKQYNIVS